MESNDRWPYNLWKDVLKTPAFSLCDEDERKSSPVLYVPNLESVLNEALNNKQRKVVKMRYEQDMTLKAIGDELGNSLEWVRQVITASKRKLREPQYFRRLNAIPESDLYQLHEEIKELRHQQRILMEQVSSLLGEPEVKKIEKRSKMPLESHINALNLSSRTSNALMSRGVITVGDLLKYSDSKLRGFRKIGPVAIAEIKAALESYDYQLPED